MAATVQIRRLTGAGAASSTDITSACTRASTSDSSTPGTSTPIPVPTSGSNYSYWVTTQLFAASAADNSLTNVKWYTDGSNSFGTGVTCNVSTASTYVQATGTSGSSGAHLTVANYSTLATDGASNAFTYTSSCKLAVAGSIAATTGSFADRVVFQLSVDTTASAGNSGEETFTWEYDEA